MHFVSTDTKEIMYYGKKLNYWSEALQDRNSPIYLQHTATHCNELQHTSTQQHRYDAIQKHTPCFLLAKEPSVSAKDLWIPAKGLIRIKPGLRVANPKDKILLCVPMESFGWINFQKKSLSRNSWDWTELIGFKIFLKYVTWWQWYAALERLMTLLVWWWLLLLFSKVV